ncbi:PAS domain-containing sensor histidine kinase [Mangrovimonas sp. YM274]|uniref:PAS domain-containing sensor histidine kinase n=1 Tax=Mangrovimonas sp. YM274 TaxID=3070660 RepID=UPI0027DCC917|nr:PAS domain-containing sensor histidine kinase [Mangrovimonas sp. YM274]WMI68088.1 PAS domain-containing sensor histidine kinase [Mangrovimonas sp. YM274]
MLKRENDVFQLLFESVSEGVVVVNQNHTIIATNSSAENMFGYEHDELLQQPLSILLPKDHQHGHEKKVSMFISEDRSRQMGKGMDLFALKKDGNLFPVEIGLNIVELHGQKIVMAIISDISVRKQHEKEILDLNAELEQKVAKRTEALSESVEELKVLNLELRMENEKRLEAEKKVKKALKKEKELNDLKTKFLSLVSHEFKTPLSGILTSTMLLGKYKLTEHQEKRDKQIGNITNKVHYLNNILTDFLSIEKLETGNISYQVSTFKLSKVVNEVIYDANMLLKEGQNIIYPEDIDDISLTQDEKIVELGLSNLVRNAIKYSPENSTIKIVIKQKKDNTIFKVIDEGVGIPKKDQKNIFKRYFRAENVLLVEGTGIGLNIVKSHLKNLGGNLTFDSKENQGTTFVMSIPNKIKYEENTVD